jgi:hypothetical protein
MPHTAKAAGQHAACSMLPLRLLCAVRRASDATAMRRRYLLQRGMLLADLRQLDLVLQR